jgi:KipI family sensor histidine kinase inhibitor
MKQTRVKQISEFSWLIEFSAATELEASLAAHRAQQQLLQLDPDGLVDTIVASRALLVIGSEPFDRAVLDTIEGSPCSVDDRVEPVLEVATRFDGPDLELVSATVGVSVDEYVRRWLEVEFVVGWIGFLPGFPYLLGLPRELQVPRRASPRVAVPPGSVATAAAYAGIYPASHPGGWQLIGTTNLELFDPEGKPPARLDVGRRVKFVSRS